MKRTIILGLTAALLLSVPVMAQDYRGRVQGSVGDETGALIPGTTVTLRNDATGVANTYVSDETGRYIFDFVDPGGYTMTAELPGFNKAEQKNVRVQQRAAVIVDFVMKIGG